MFRITNEIITFNKFRCPHLNKNISSIFLLFSSYYPNYRQANWKNNCCICWYCISFVRIFYRHIRTEETSCKRHCNIMRDHRYRCYFKRKTNRIILWLKFNLFLQIARLRASSTTRQIVSVCWYWSMVIDRHSWFSRTITVLSAGCVGIKFCLPVPSIARTSACRCVVRTFTKRRKKK